jgi:probable rRNA maturation factor
MLKILDNPYQIDKEYYTSKLKAVTNELNIRGTICIKLGSEKESRQLNLSYRKKDYPTDVLSFPLNEKLPDGFYVGDIFICYPLAREQAKENHLTVEQELLTLMLHGILHLVGYDHETDTGEMAALQEKLLKGETK